MTDQDFFELVQAKVREQLQNCFVFAVDYGDYRLEKDNLDERSMNEMVEEINCTAEKYVQRIKDCYINSIQDVNALGFALTTDEFDEVLGYVNDECPEKLSYEHYGLGEYSYILHADNGEDITIATFNLY